MNETAAAIEAFLLSAQGWVSSSTLCAKFDVKERALRADGNEPGLCTTFAISGDKGFRHIRHATDEEFDRFYARGRNHGIRQLVRLRRLRRARANLVVRQPPPETPSGQFLLLR